MNLPEIIRQAMEIGERNGRITFDELNELCGNGIDVDPKDIERLLSALGEAGIWVEDE